MADLARELDVSVRTLRRYFAKADIVWSPLRRILDDRRAILETSDRADPPMDVIRRAICSSLSSRGTNPEELRTVVRLTSSTPTWLRPKG